jgi:hypothetical protein
MCAGGYRLQKEAAGALMLELVRSPAFSVFFVVAENLDPGSPYTITIHQSVK